jgi:fluoroquinolone resistance protein
MDIIIHEDKTFDNIDYSERKLLKREFVNCIFNSCNFQKSDLGNNDFIDCQFNSCNFSLAVLDNTGLKNIIFFDCKLIGIEIGKCSNFQFSVSFQNCQLNYSSFFQKKMKKTNFTGCSLKEVDFNETDLSAAVFKDCDLLGASFVRTILEKTDFRTAINYSIDPEVNKIKKAKFSYLGIAGLLTKYDIDIEF